MKVKKSILEATIKKHFESGKTLFFTEIVLNENDYRYLKTCRILATRDGNYYKLEKNHKMQAVINTPRNQIIVSGIKTIGAMSHDRDQPDEPDTFQIKYIALRDEDGKETETKMFDEDALTHLIECNFDFRADIEIYINEQEYNQILK